MEQAGEFLDIIGAVVLPPEETVVAQQRLPSLIQRQADRGGAARSRGAECLNRQVAPVAGNEEPGILDSALASEQCAPGKKYPCL